MASSTAERKTIFSTGLLLLAAVVFTIFLAPVMPRSSLPYVYPVCFTFIFVISAFTLQKRSALLTRTAIFICVITWIAFVADFSVMRALSRSLQFIFFFYLVAALIRQVATPASIGRKAIVDAITGYLMLGFALCMLAVLITVIDPGAYNFSANSLAGGLPNAPFHEFMYYTFVTYTTTGYGDLLPVTPAAKSLAILMGVSGQLYVATILAMLVGKYTSSNK